MKPVIQQESTGCGIASAAAIAGLSYKKAKRLANSLGIHADDSSLWSDTQHVRKLLRHLGVRTGRGERPFKDWQSLPSCALLSIKWHMDKGKPYWHWVVFAREGEQAYVLDSRKALKNHRRTDFGRMRPKWFIEIYK